MIDKLINLATRRSFNDWDFAEDDAYLDAQFSHDERGLDLGFVSTLVSATPNAGRIPWTSILKPLGKQAKFVPGWSKRGSPVMAPIGLLNHWTAGTNSLNICINGRSDVPGPLVHLLASRDGTMHVIASGRANHAGRGHALLINEWKRNKVIDPRTAKQRKLADTGGSGGSLIGLEVEAKGTGPAMPEAQRLVCAKTLALVAVWYRWPAEKVSLHHAMWTQRKVDYVHAKGLGMPPWTAPGKQSHTIVAADVTAQMAWAYRALRGNV